MNISGILLQVRPDAAAQVIGDLAEIPGAELHQQSADGRMVITLEAADPRAAGESVPIAIAVDVSNGPQVLGV